MNAAPISVNAATGGNASGGASAQEAKASTLPAFAQVMAEKQAAVSRPKESATSSGTENANAANESASAAAQKSSDTRPVNVNCQPDGVADSAKKSDAKGKNSNDAGAGKSATQTSAQLPAQAAQIPAIVPGLNGTMPWVAPADLGSATPRNAEATNSTAGNIAPIDPAATKAGVANAAATSLVATQRQLPAASELPGPIGTDLQNLPVSNISMPGIATAATKSTSNANPAPATKPADGQNEAQAVPIEIPKTASGENTPNVANLASVGSAMGAAGSLPAAGNDSAVSTAAANTGTAAGSQAAPATSEAKPADLSAVAVLPAATAAPVSQKTQSAPKVSAGRGAQEILWGAAAFVGKDVQAATQVSVSGAKDFVGAIKGKSGASDNAAPVASQLAVGAKNETPASVNAEPAMTGAAQTPDKVGSAKSGSNIKGNSSGDAGSSGNSGGSAGTAVNGKDSAVSADPNAAHGAMPAGQNDAVRLGANPANVAPAPSVTAEKDSGSTMAAKVGDASNSGELAAPDADDMGPQLNESRVVNVAQLTGDQGHSQVRIAMQAEQLGQVELHATVRGQQVGAAITVEKKEAHAAMAAEMPSLQQALEARQLRVGEVVFMQGALHSTAGDAGNGAAEQQRRGQAGSTYQQVENETAYEARMGTNFESSGIFDDSGRLSVRA